VITKPAIRAPDDPYAQQVLAAVAWALKHRLPLPEVLRALPFGSQKGFRNVWGHFRDLRGRTAHLFWLAAIIASSLMLLGENSRPHFSLALLLLLLLPLILPPRSCCWSWRVQKIVERMEAGQPLHRCLHFESEHLWSPSFIAVVEQLEDDGQLASGFPKLVEHERWLEDRRPIDSFLPLAFIQVGFIAVCLFFFIVVANKLNEDELIPLADAPIPMLILLVPFGLLVFGLMLYPRKFGATFRRLLPFFRRLQATRDLERATARLLLHGSVDRRCVQSAQATAKHIEEPWLAVRLQRFADDLAAGHPWGESWVKAGIGPAHLRSLAAAFAASGMPPQAVLMRVHAVASEDVARHTRFLHRWSAPLMSLPVLAFAAWAWWNLVNGLVKALDAFPEAW